VVFILLPAERTVIIQLVSPRGGAYSRRAKMDRTYRVVLDPDPEDGGYTVTVPAMPGVVTQGDTVGQCLERAREAIALHLAAMAKDDEHIEVELDKGPDEPIFGPLAQTEMSVRFRLAVEIVGKLGG